MSNRSFMSGAKTSMSIREPESHTLYRHIEEMTEKLEKEKRESIYLEQQLEMLKEELITASAFNKSKFIPGASEVQLKNKLHVLEKKLDLEITSLNEMRSHNRLIRSEVNTFRRDKRHYKRTLQSLNESLMNTSLKHEEIEKVMTQKVNVQMGNKKLIETLRSKSQDSRANFTQRMSQFSSFISEEKEKELMIHKRIERGILGQLNKPGDNIEIARLIRLLVNKWKEKLKDKQRILETYSKFVKKINDGFDEIKNASGISNIDEIVVALIKSEQQMYEVCAYINNMNAEIDHLEEIQHETLDAIKSYSVSKEHGITKMTSILENSIKKLENLQKIQSIKAQETVNLKASIDSLTPILTVNFI